MSDAKFTKGEWQALPEECDKPCIRIRGTVPGGRYKICNVLTPVYYGVHEREAIETRANAALIAAAPEMYEMLDSIRQCLEWGYTNAELIDNINEYTSKLSLLLSKARGEQ